jgi:hypothetical protein
MTYEVVLRRKNSVIFFKDYCLDGLVPPHVMDMMLFTFVNEELGLCEKCEVACQCHVMQPLEEGPHCYRKLCPVLFHDAFKPPWKIEELA